MRVELTDEPPRWVESLSDSYLRRRFGGGTVDRAKEYAARRAVQTLSTGEHGRLLLASVRGSGRNQYQTLVIADDDLLGEPTQVTGRCSCPVQVDCKHVVAVLLTARQALPTVAAASGWEKELAELLVPAEPEAAPSVLGLEFEIVAPNRGRYADAGEPRVRIRPVVPGKTGWIKTGASWRDIGADYGRDDPPLQALRTLLALYRSTQRPWEFYSEPSVYLDELGPRCWRLLREAVDAGVTLTTGKKNGANVTVSPSPVAVSLDLSLADDGDAHLAVELRLSADGEQMIRPVDEPLLLGDPVHGIVLARQGGLLIAALDPAMDAATRRLYERGQLTIGAGEVPQFLNTAYPALRRRLPVASRDGSVTLPEIAPPRLALDVAFEPSHVTTLDWSFRYGDRHVPITAHDTVRDPAAEAALLAGLDVLDAVPGLRVDVHDAPGPSGVGMQRRLVPTVRLTGLRTAAFVSDVLPALRGREDLELRESGKPVEYVEAVDAPLITVATHDDPANPDWFDLTVDVSVGGQVVPFLELFTALARHETCLILEGGTYFRLDRPELDALRRLIEEARALDDRPGNGMRLSVVQAGLWEELVELGVVAQQSERWRRSAGALLDLTELPHPAAPSGLRAALRPYQLDGYQWLSLLWDLQLGGVLADDMGLGKTMQTLAMLLRAREIGLEEPVLIVAPTSVVGTWVAEAAKFCPELSVVAVTETERKSGVPIAKAAIDADVVVTSYALFRIDEDAYQAQKWSGLVLDEAQFVKNHQAKTYQCARRLPAPFKLAITGTPLENSLMDLWSMLSITAPGLFPSPQRFTETYRRPIESGAAPEALATLRKRVRPLMLRRTKEAVAPELPPKIETVLEVTLNPGHRKVYDTYLHRERQRVLRLVDDLDRNRFEILKSLTLLRQLSLDASLVDGKHAGVRSSKVEVLVEQLRELAGEGHRALVFSQFTGFLRVVRDRLTAEGIGYCYLDGRTRNRPDRIASFRDGEDPVFLISLKAGGFGLTLTEADYVFVLDPWWNPATEAQAIDRTHRIGQDKTVMVYRMVAAATIEEKVVALQQRKRDLFARVIDGGGAVDGALTADDIRGLFAS